MRIAVAQHLFLMIRQKKTRDQLHCLAHVSIMALLNQMSILKRSKKVKAFSDETDWINLLSP